MRRDSVGTQFDVGGYAVAVILLLVAALESFVARDRHFSKKQPLRKHVTTPEYMKEIYRYHGYKRLSELFVVRDAIIHSHVWVIKYALPKVGGHRFLSASRKRVPANRIGHYQVTAAQLKTIQEVITLVMFCVFSVVYLKEELKWNYIAGFAMMVGAVFIIFKEW